MAGDPRSSYSFETKLAAVQAHIEGGLTSSEAMRAYDIVSKSAYFRWCSAYKEQGEEGLKPKKRGRPRKG